MTPIFPLFFLLCAGVTLLAISAFWPRHRLWLLPLLALPWIGTGLLNVVERQHSSAALMPPALAVALPFLAFVVDRWRSLRVRSRVWIVLAVIVVGWCVFSAAAGEIGLNHDGQYCTESSRALGHCRLDPLLVANVYLTAFGMIVVFLGSVPALVLFAVLAYRRWSRIPMIAPDRAGEVEPDHDQHVG